MSASLRKTKAAERKKREAVKSRNVAETKKDHAEAELQRLLGEINSPHIDDFLKAVRLEAIHQRERWGTEHDEGKHPTDWIWLLGFLAGKACTAAVQGDKNKALHHTISSAAVLLNWHAYISGDSMRLRPGQQEPV